MTYTVHVYDYNSFDYNDPLRVQEFVKKADAITFAQDQWEFLQSFTRGRVAVDPLNPTTGYHDLPPVWERESRRYR